MFGEYYLFFHVVSRICLWCWQLSDKFDRDIVHSSPSGHGDTHDARLKMSQDHLLDVWCIANFIDILETWNLKFSNCTKKLKDLSSRGSQVPRQCTTSSLDILHASMYRHSNICMRRVIDHILRLLHLRTLIPLLNIECDKQKCVDMLDAPDWRGWTADSAND